MHTPSEKKNVKESFFFFFFNSKVKVNRPLHRKKTISVWSSGCSLCLVVLKWGGGGEFDAIYVNCGQLKNVCISIMNIQSYTCYTTCRFVPTEPEVL